MHPKLMKCFSLAKHPRLVSIGSEHDTCASPSSVRDEAQLLLSIADICRSEIKHDGLSAIWGGMPNIPTLSNSEEPPKPISPAPRTESLRELVAHAFSREEPLRIRSVSIDDQDHPTSPRFRHKSLRQNIKARRGHVEEEEEEPDPVTPRGKALQGAVPKGVSLTRIQRKKFSWKNYPELEQFLVANREEYLRHSALNYTVQQKQYNNCLTARLLELATSHGYIFDTHEFSFVTVRDRIRCYFKSYVQSAKKRGVLMGYAARKAGLVSEEELQAVSQNLTIVSP